MEYCYVFDYSDSTISEITLKKEDKELDAEELLTKYGFDVDYCSFMYTTTRIDDINRV